MKLLPYLLMFALINSCIELEISAPGFPDIMSYFGVSEYIVGLTMTMNLIGFCIAAVLYGPLSDSIGRRRVMLFGNGVLALGAILCTLATSIHFLLIARFIQGFGAATSAVVVSAIIADQYKTEKASKLYGIMNTVFTTLMAMSPILGGVINNAVGWRGNYGLIAMICIISWFLLFWFLPETSKNKNNLEIYKILANYKSLLTSSKFLSAASVPSLLYGSYMAFVAISPFIYMNTLKLGMLAYTINTAFVVASFAVVSGISHSITILFGTKRTILLGLGLLAIGAFNMCLSQNYLLLSASMSVFSMGFALIYPIVFARSMEIFPEIKGTESSAIMSLRYLICAIITTIGGLAFNGSIFSLGAVLAIIALLSAIICMFLLTQTLFE